tara:strand:+ start:6582 stop:7709 length:1128 start_codon:yes stop_codon:yes gene_type:complete
LEEIINMAGLDTGRATRSLTEVMSLKASNERKHVAIQKKIDRRREITNEQLRRLRAKEAAVAAALRRFNASDSKLTELCTEVRNLAKEKETYDNVESESLARLEHLNEVYGDEDTTKHRAAMLHALTDLIDNDHPIKYDIRDYGVEGYEQVLGWRTKSFPITVRRVDEDGRQLFSEGSNKTKTLFGPFDVKISRYFYGSSGTATISPSALGTEDAERVNDYCHPHISINGDLCMGTSKYMALEYMKKGDYVSVIRQVMDVLLGYNPRDPYQVLNIWEPNIHNVSSCGTCGEVLLHCDCPRDIVTGEVVDEKFLNDCGSTYQNCLIHHERGDAEDGINGSRCHESRHSRRRDEKRIESLISDITKIDILLRKITIL